MLSIGKLGIGQERYYLDKVAEGAEDYYSGEGEAAGQWLGDAAEGLGLDGAVEPEQLTAMLTGRNPATGEPLWPPSGRRPGRRPRIRSHLLRSEVGLAAVGARGPGPAPPSPPQPKAPGRRTRLPPARGVLDAARSGGRVRQGQRLPRRSLRHRSSRAGDPQVHIHTLIANATQGPDGKWTRLYHPAIYDHAKTAGYLFEAHFRADLSRRLGVGWQEVRNGIAEVEGFADDHLRTFSTRRQQILEAAGPEASARSNRLRPWRRGPRRRRA